MYFPQNMHKAFDDPTFKASKVIHVALIGAAILFLVPADRVLALPLLGDAVNSIAAWIPSIGRWVELSAFPESTKLFVVFMWASIPVQTVLIVRCREGKSAFQEKQPKSPWLLLRDLLRVSALLTPMIWLGYVFVVVDATRCLGLCPNSSKFAMWFIGCIFALSISGLVGMTIWQIQLLINYLKTRGRANHV